MHDNGASTTKPRGDFFFRFHPVSSPSWPRLSHGKTKHVLAAVMSGPKSRVLPALPPARADGRPVRHDINVHVLEVQRLEDSSGHLPVPLDLRAAQCANATRTQRVSSMANARRLFLDCKMNRWRPICKAFGPAPVNTLRTYFSNTTRHNHRSRPGFYSLLEKTQRHKRLQHHKHHPTPPPLLTSQPLSASW